MNSLFSSTLDTVAPLRLRKIKEKSPTLWYNAHTRTLKRAARKMERSWRKTKIKHSALVQAGLVVKLRYLLIGEIQTRPLSADPTPKLSIGKTQTGRLT